MRILFLDDNPERHKVFSGIGHWVQRVYNAQDTIYFLSHGEFDLVYLDHDLGGPESEGKLLDGVQDGRYLARWIADNKDRFGKTVFVIHSLNPMGSVQMQSIISSAGLEVWRSPFAWKVTPQELLKAANA